MELFRLSGEFCPGRSELFEDNPAPIAAPPIRLVVGCGANSIRFEPVQLGLLTESLDRGRRTRLDRVFDDWGPWDQEVPWGLTRRRPSNFVQLVAWLIHSFLFGWLSYRRERKEAVAFESYLRTAHLHEEVARQSSLASRRWFANWRQQAQIALRLGMSPNALLSLLKSTPVGRRPRAAVGRPVRRRDAATAESRERLRNTIFPNAPGATDSLRHLVTGDGLATARI